MNVTNDYKLEQINKSSNKNAWRVRSFKEDVEVQISQYRLYALNHKGTYVAYWCGREANYLEKELTLALKGLRS